MREIFNKPLNIPFATLLLWLCGITLTVLPVMADPKIAYGKRSISLCEIYVMDATTPACPDFFPVFTETAKDRCLTLVHPGDDESPMEHSNDAPAAKNARHSLPLIIIDGKTFLSASSEGSWRNDLHKILQQNERAEKWDIDLYLSIRHSRENSLSVDFSVCNKQKSERLNGSFILWMAEKKEVVFGRKYWVATKKITNSPIRNLPPSGVAGCSLPDQFSLPEISDEKKYSVIAIVYSTDSRVQAVAIDTLSPYRPEK